MNGRGSDGPSSSSSSSASASTAASARAAALMERRMEAKLRALDAEYEECINATRKNAGPYANLGHSSSLPVDNDHPDEEWSEAWAEYKRAAAEEEAEARANGITDEDVENQTKPIEPPPKPEPLSEAKLATISNVMSNIKLKPPPWAIGLPEEIWMTQILQRAGIVMQPRQHQHQHQTNTNDASSTTATNGDEKKRKKKKKKSKKDKSTSEQTIANQQQSDDSSISTSAAADPSSTSSTADDSFNPVFPPLPPSPHAQSSQAQ